MNQNNDSPRPAIFELPLNPNDQLDTEKGKLAVSHFRSALSINNASWFCRLRWGIVLILTFSGLLGLISGFSEKVGYRPNPTWLFITAGILSVFNVAYLQQIRKIIALRRTDLAEWNLRVQIAVDLAFLTVVVHFLGSIETYAPFLYLLHIVLSCIFFSRNHSLIIMLLAFGMYLACLGLEALGVLAAHDGIYTDPRFRTAFGELQIFTNVVTVFAIFLTLWSLASRIAKMIYERERELAIANQRLLRTQTEKTRHMLRTTHELKAPFAAIHANTQLLINGYCGSINPEALAVIRRIAERAGRLSAEIQSMLQLANLTSVERQSLKWTRMDLSDLLTQCLEPLRPLAASRNIIIQEDLQPLIVFGVEDHLKMMFSNLLANAVNYSRNGGTVRISCRQMGQFARTIIEDHGIGILPEKLPRIFEEHYRTEEAAAHNKESSGLGLAIVRSVALMHQLPISVESTAGEGTTFTISIPTLDKELDSKRSQGALNRIKHVLGYLRGV